MGESRKAFEIWFVTNIGYPIGTSGRTEYRCWLAWQASRHSLEVQSYEAKQRAAGIKVKE